MSDVAHWLKRARDSSTNTHPTLGPVPSIPTRLGKVPCSTPAPLLQNQAARGQNQPTTLYYFAQGNSSAKTQLCPTKSAHFV